MSSTPIILLRALPAGIVFSAKTPTVKRSTQLRFITPPTKSNSIRAQQHPRQNSPWYSPISNEPLAPPFHLLIKKPAGLWHARKQVSLSFVNWKPPAEMRTIPEISADTVRVLKSGNSSVSYFHSLDSLRNIKSRPLEFCLVWCV